jgi:hypothetical protein
VRPWSDQATCRDANGQQNNSTNARALQAILSIALLSISAVLLASSFKSTAGQANKAPTSDDNHHDCDHHGNDCNTATPIKHVIVIVGENRSFDHLFATYVPKPGVTVNNLLSEGIVNADGTPGANYSRATQFQADITGSTTYQPSPMTGKTVYLTLPAPLNGGPTDVCIDNGMCNLCYRSPSPSHLRRSWLFQAHNPCYADHVSILKFIEHNWGLPAICGRSRDNLPNPTYNPAVSNYAPINTPAISDLLTCSTSDTNVQPGRIRHPPLNSHSCAILNYQGTASDATVTDLLCGLVGQWGVGEGDGGGVGKGVIKGRWADTGPGAFRVTQAIAATATISGIAAGRRTCDRRWFRVEERGVFIGLEITDWSWTFTRICLSSRD